MIKSGLALCLWVLCAVSGLADPAANAFLASRQPLFTIGGGARPVVTSASLFVGEAEGGLFAALPGRLDAPLTHGGTTAARLRDLIAGAEAGPMGYDAVQHGARIAPPKRPNDMTLDEIYAWIDATPGQPHAIGRYQFIPATLNHSARRLGLSTGTRFSPATQDRLADLLLGDAGLMKVETGEITHEAFMLNLAKIWAGLPVASGRSYYDGVAGNKAVISYDRYAREIRDILDG